MARSYATVGQMMTYAVDRSVSSPDIPLHQGRDGNVELLLRHMLEFVLMAPRSREAFMRTIVRDERPTGSIVAEPRPHRSAPDLVAEILPSSAGDEPARLGVTLRVGRSCSAGQVARVRAALGEAGHHVLLLVVRKAESDQQMRAVDQVDPAVRPVPPHGEAAEPAGTDGPELVVTTWNRIGRRMAKADPGHAHLWETIGEIGENAGAPVVQYPLNARRLLSDRDTAREMRAHLDLFRRASRTLLGTSPRFSTRRGQDEARLQAGRSRRRTGLAFGEVDHGTPIHVLRADGASAPLGIGLPESSADHAAAEEALAALARRTAWRTEDGDLPTAEELIGTPAAPEVEGARLLLWAVFNPALLHDRGFDLAPARRQPTLTDTTLAMRLVQRGDDSGTLYRLWVGGRRRWDTLIPRVTREAAAGSEEETYAVAPRKGQSTSDFVWEVHKALRSLTF
ncbi:hypothetical protein [Brachybacterium sp. YJGR34]|uniref:hypothetical protein n=1 Tax=Brachybacterium sp. YJGR34 TaxID=2059911 RepID=UPI000E0B9092|nr:hypothetical protein [Brachybacterium sp. YJGR34]